jgi:hypothetical protein
MAGAWRTRCRGNHGPGTTARHRASRAPPSNDRSFETHATRSGLQIQRQRGNPPRQNVVVQRAGVGPRGRRASERQRRSHVSGHLPATTTQAAKRESHTCGRTRSNARCLRCAPQKPRRHCSQAGEVVEVPTCSARQPNEAQRGRVSPPAARRLPHEPP